MSTRKGRSCEFAYCGANKRDNPDRIFFKFPVKTPNICKEWVDNCADERLSDLPDRLLHYRTVCNCHFTRECFDSDMRTRLVPHAVPTLLDMTVQDRQPSPPQPTSPPHQPTALPLSTYSTGPSALRLSTPVEATSSPVQSVSRPVIASNEKDVIIPLTSCDHNLSTPSTSSQEVNVSSITPAHNKRIIAEDTPRKRKLRKSIKRLKGVQQKTRMQLLRIKSKPTKLSKDIIFNAASSYIKSGPFKTLLKMQMMHKKNSAWTEEEKQLTLSMFYKSPALYNDLRCNKDFVLPSRSVIKNWLQVDNLKPGISEEVLEKVKLKAKEMSVQERQVVLMFDEMSIKKCLQYNQKRDIIEGFHDLGDLGRKPDIATHAMVFLVRGLMNKWKMPVAYYITSDLKGGDLANLIMQVVEALLDVGLNVRALICDQGSNNQKAAKVLGFGTNNSFLKIRDKKIYFLYDVPHLIKSVRNILMRSDISFSEGTAKWDHIETLYEMDAVAGKARSLCKLTPKHIKPNSFEKMRVKLATQVFSNTVKAAMMTGVATSELPIAAEHTALFVGRMNDLFDCLNSKVQFDSNPLRCAISSTSQGQQVLQKLKESVAWVKSWQRVKTTKKQMTIPCCFSGLISTITAIIQLWDDMREDGFKFLLTNRLSQDALENEFAIQRQRCGYERNPSAMRFRQNLRFRMLVVMLKPPGTSNCEVDDDIMTVPSDSQLPENDTDPEEDGPIQDIPSADLGQRDEFVSDADTGSSDGEEDAEGPDDLEMAVDQPTGGDQDNGVEMTAVLSDQPQTKCDATLETCSIQYVAGYLAVKLWRKFGCESCRTDLMLEEMLLDEENELLILHRSFATTEGVSHLAAPSPEMAAITQTILAVFLNNFDRVKTMFGVKAILIDLARAEIAKCAKEWLKIGKPCYSHREFIIDLCIKLKIVKHISWESQSLLVPKPHKNIQKLKNIMNK